MAADSQARCVYYSRARVIALALFGVFVVVLFVTSLPTAIAAPHNTVNLIIGSVLFVVTVIAIVRLIRCVVIADAGGLTVRNPLRTYRIAWRDVYGIDQGFFSFGSGGAVGTGRIVQIALSADRKVRAHALATYIGGSRNKAGYTDRVIEELTRRAVRIQNQQTVG